MITNEGNLNLLPRCWFIFALGATPSIAMKNTFLGFIIRKRNYNKELIHNITQ